MKVFDEAVPMPKARSYKRRLNYQLRQIQPGMSKALEPRAAACLAAFIRSQGGQPRQQKEGNRIRVWWAI